MSILDLIRNEVKKDRERNGLTNGHKDRDEPTNGQTEQFSGQAERDRWIDRQKD